MFPYDPHSPESGSPVEPIPEAQRILAGLLSELPEEARQLVEKIDGDIAKLREQTAEKIAALQDETAQKVAQLQDRQDQKERTMLKHAVEQLEPLQKDLFRSGDLGAALATFVKIQSLKSRAESVLPDPGNLRRFEQAGNTFAFRIVGQNNGPVWGTDVYTSDSHLATAAVHAGAVEVGEEGIVRATVVSLSGQRIFGSIRNGVQSMDWGPYPVGYRVTRSG